MESGKVKATLVTNASWHERRNKENEIEKGGKIVTKVLELCHGFKLFHNQDGDGFALVQDKSITKVVKIQSGELKKYLSATYYKKHDDSVNSSVLKEAIEVLEARAFHDGVRQQTYSRVANLKDKIYVDLCNDARQCIEIDAAGFRILNQSPVMFERKSGMISLPIPEPGGSIMKLKEFINVHDEQFPLIIAWIIGTLRGVPPFPILIVQGTQGSGKSTFTEILRKIVDPSEVLLRGVIKDERDLVVSAKSSYMIVMDNVSKMNYEMTDRLCQMSTGGGFSKRKLYSDSDEVLLKVQNPIVLNGINFIPDRPDLLERSILIDLSPLTGKWNSKEQLMQRFDEALPEILGAIYALLSTGLRELPNTKLETYPRMADFALFVSATESGLDYEPGATLRLLDKNQDELASYSIDENIFASVLFDYLRQNKIFSGTAHELLNTLNEYTQRYDNKYGYAKTNPEWPRGPQKVGRIIARIRPYLSRLGVRIDKSRSSDRHSRKVIHFSLEELY